MDLNGAVAIVTGAARGLGKAIAKGYAARLARVAIVDILEDELCKTADEIEEAGGAVLPILTDISVLPQVEAMAARVWEEFGPTDVLINNAGRFSTIGPIWELDIDNLLQDVMVNFYGTLLCCRAVVKGMIERRSGYILNMIGGGVGSSSPYNTSYACSKTAVMRLTEGLANEVKDYGVKVFAMLPGVVLTDMNRYLLESPEGRKWRPTFRQVFEGGRDLSPQSIVDLTIDLVSGQADQLTGRLFRATRNFDEIIRNSEVILGEDLLTLRLSRLE